MKTPTAYPTAAAVFADIENQAEIIGHAATATEALVLLRHYYDNTSSYPSGVKKVCPERHGEGSVDGWAPLFDPGHTPGPWHACGTGIRDNSGKFQGLIGSATQLWANVVTPISEVRANARLMAAAPCLLAALLQWQEFARNNYAAGDISFMAATDAAILKATGGEA